MTEQKQLAELDLKRYPGPHYFTYKGYSCEMKRNVFKTWCGYVHIPNNHPLYYSSYLKVDELNTNIHGGITWGGNGYFGFDCAHYNDFIPGYENDVNDESATYKDYCFVINEIKKLVDFFIDYE